MDKECVTHHHACDCREAYFAQLEAKVEHLEGFINDLLDPKTNWPLERIQAHLDRIDEWQEVSDGD